MNASVGPASACLPWPKSKREAPPDNVFVSDSQLAQELNALTVQERNVVYEEVHGVNETIEETPEFVAKKILEMREQLTATSKPKRRALNRAFFLRPSLEHDDKFFLLFLRSVRFDAAAAAKRFCLHFEHKLMLFGEDKLVKKITLDDLSAEDKEIMALGPLEFVTVRDRGGRVLNYCSIKRYNFDPKRWESFARTIWYHGMRWLEDENVQINGVIYLLDLIGGDLSINQKLFEIQWQCRKILPFLPSRPCGVHLMYNNPHLDKFIQGLFQYILPKELRLRVRCHFGSPQEVRYSLLTFGINLGSYFDDPQGLEAHALMRAEIEKHQAHYLQERKRQDEEEERSNNIAYPKPNDLLIGRGRPYRDHPGGRLLATMAANYVDEYRATERRSEKTQISLRLVEEIKGNGGRFLQRTATGWERVDDYVAREKVSQALRMEVRLKTGLETASSDPDEDPDPDPKRLRAM